MSGAQYEQVVDCAMIRAGGSQAFQTGGHQADDEARLPDRSESARSAGQFISHERCGALPIISLAFDKNEFFGGQPGLLSGA